MRIVDPSVKLLAVTPAASQLIEQAGRTCYKSESRITDDSAERFVAMLLERGHESVIEHASATVRIVCDRGVSHEIVRHRIASYSQESTRYCNYEGGVTFVRPPWCGDVGLGEYENTTLHKRCRALREAGLLTQCHWLRSVATVNVDYRQLLNDGCTLQQARSVLPNSLKTEIVMTANFREWRHFFRLRLSSKAHPQMRQTTAQILDVLHPVAPTLFQEFQS